MILPIFLIVCMICLNPDLNHRILFLLRYQFHDISREMYMAVLPCCSREGSCYRLLYSLMVIRDHKLHAPEAFSFRSSTKNSHPISVSESQSLHDNISLFPSPSMPMHTYRDLFPYLPSCLILKYVASMYMNFIDLSIFLRRKDCTFASSSDTSDDT